MRKASCPFSINMKRLGRRERLLLLYPPLHRQLLFIGFLTTCEGRDTLLFIVSQVLHHKSKKTKEKQTAQKLSQRSWCLSVITSRISFSFSTLSTAYLPPYNHTHEHLCEFIIMISFCTVRCTQAVTRFRFHRDPFDMVFFFCSVIW